MVALPLHLWFALLGLLAASRSTSGQAEEACTAEGGEAACTAGGDRAAEASIEATSGELEGSDAEEDFASLPLRERYLRRHPGVVAVIPSAVSAGQCARLKTAVDRRWRNLDPDRIEELLGSGYDGDNIVENTDMEPSFSCDVIEAGICTAGDEDQYVEEEDCDIVSDLLAEVVDPLMQQTLDSWHQQGLADDLPKTLYACDSFIKRYLPGERTSLNVHKDDAVLTANVLLTDPSEFQGGLELYPHVRGSTKREEKTGVLRREKAGRGVFLEQGPGVGIGDIVIHRGHLWHGVRMLKENTSRRYTWITWYAEDEADCKTEGPDVWEKYRLGIPEEPKEPEESEEPEEPEEPEKPEEP